METQRPYGGSFAGRTHYFALRVYIEDTDLGGVVYHANYLRFMERARSDLLRCLGIDQRAAIENREGVYAVSELQIKYQKPAKLGDELIIASAFEEIRGASCVIAQRILREADKIAFGIVRVAFLGLDGRPRRQPLQWVKKFEAHLEKNVQAGLC